MIDPVGSDDDRPDHEPALDEGVDEVVVVGASAGGITALQRFLGAVPTDYAGAICVVLHLAPNRTSFLPRILERDSPLPVVACATDQRLEPGHVYVAAPDRHLALHDGRVVLDVGPSENGHRPSIDVLFRTAARTRGPAVVGVILSGSLDDGAAGLREIKARGGRAAVQDPTDADYPSMPHAALEAVHADVVGTASELGAWLGSALRPQPAVPWRSDGPTPVEAATDGNPVAGPYLTCPDCHGALHDTSDGNLIRFDCLIGHKWSAASLEAHQRVDVEESMWAAVRALEEQAAFNRRLAERSVQLRRPGAARSFDQAAARAKEHADRLRRIAHDVTLDASEIDPMTTGDLSRTAAG